MTGDDDISVDGAAADREPGGPIDAVTLAPPSMPAGTTGSGTRTPGSPGLPGSGVDADGPSVLLPPPDYNQAGVPSLDFVRNKIEGRYAMSLGSTELAQETPEARSFEKQAAEREEAARERLESIRRSLRGGSPS